MSPSLPPKNRMRNKRWELKFATRITLIFGFLGLFALLISMLYAVHTAENYLQDKIDNNFIQRQRTVQSLIENRALLRKSMELNPKLTI